MAENFTVVIDRIELVQSRDEYADNYYTPNTERYLYQAKVMAHDATNPRKVFFFNADNLKMRVAAAGPVAVVGFENEGTFITMPQNYAVTADSTNVGEAPQLKVAAGETITIRATVKNGRLTRVKRI